MSLVIDDFYRCRELNLVLDYFERKARGDYSVPVPSQVVFDHVVGSTSASIALATFAERELRAIYLGIGRPVSQGQAAELMDAWQSGEASVTDREIADLESELYDLESKIERMESERDVVSDLLDAKRGDKEKQVIRFGGEYVPEDLMPVIEQLQREGA